MKKNIAKIITVLICKALICINSYAEGTVSIDVPGTLTKVNRGFNTFAKEVQKSIPNAVTVNSEGLVKNEPYFTAGINISASYLDSSSLSETFTNMSSLFSVIGHNISMSIPENLVLPCVTVNARAGNIFNVPLDFGFMFSFISSDSFKINPQNPDTFININSPVKINRGSFKGNAAAFNIGFSALYTFLMNREYLPDMAAEMGWYCSKGGVSMKATDVNENGTLNVNMGQSFFTQVISADFEASKKFNNITPFARNQLLWVQSKNGWVRKVYLDGMYMPLSGSNCINLNFTDFYFAPQISAGCRINAGPVLVTASAAFDIRNTNIGGALSARYILPL